MARWRRASGPRLLSGPCRPFLNAHGKAAWWAIFGLVLLAVFVVAGLRYWDSGPDEKPSLPVDVIEKQGPLHPRHRYKIERPARPVSEVITSESPLQTGDDEIVQGLPSVGEPMEVHSPIPSAETADRTDPQVSAPALETDRQPGEAVSAQEAIPDRERPQDGTQTAGGEQPRAGQGPLAQNAAKLPDSISTEKTTDLRGTPLQQSGKVAGTSFFVNTDVANVRERPTMGSRVLFHVWRGRSVTVTGKRKGWYRVNTGDGRSGWVSRRLLTDIPVSPTDIVPTLREIKAIRVGPRENQTTRVAWELSSPYVPEIFMIDEKPPRIVCDFMDAALAPAIAPRIPVNDGVIRSIRVGLHSRPQVKVRMVLDLEPGKDYEVRKVSKHGEDWFVLEIQAVGNP